MPNPILIAGYGLAPIHAIEQLIGAGYKPADIGLLTHQRDDNEFLIDFAGTRGLGVMTFSVKDPICLRWIQERNFHTLVSLYYRSIIPASVLDHFEGRAMNLHAGRLPEYRGCWSTPWSIINGEVDACFSYHYMTPEIDDGKLLAVGSVDIDHTDTAFSVYHRLLRKGVERFMPVLERVLDGLSGYAQVGEPRYYPRAIPFDGYIDPTWSDEQVDRFIRAMYFPPHPGAKLKMLDGTEREILSMEEYHRCLAAF